VRGAVSREHRSTDETSHHAPGLDGETIQPWIGEPKPVVSCLYDAGRSTLTIEFQLNGGATGPYWPGFTMKAAAQFAEAQRQA
jgi:hypothetical protein